MSGQLANALAGKMAMAMATKTKDSFLMAVSASVKGLVAVEQVRRRGFDGRVAVVRAGDGHGDGVAGHRGEVVVGAERAAIERSLRAVLRNDRVVRHDVSVVPHAH